MNDIERFKKITDDMYELYKKKNSNYGNSFEKLFNELGEVAGLVPLHNKLDRITNIVKGGNCDFESVEDSLIDLANYSIMMYMELQKKNENSTDECSGKHLYVDTTLEEDWMKYLRGKDYKYTNKDFNEYLKSTPNDYPFGYQFTCNIGDDK